MLLNSLALCVEWLSPRHRELYSGVSGGVYTAGQLLLAGLAFGIRDWRLLQIVISVPYFVFFLWSWFTPESARWLIQRGRFEAALKELRFVAKVNGRRAQGDKLSLQMLRAAMGKEGSLGRPKRHGAIDLLRQPQLRRRTLALSAIFFTTSFSYYGVALNLQSFGVDVYLMQLVFGAIDIPAKALALLGMALAGRRATQSAALLSAAVALLGMLIVPLEMTTLRACVVVLGKGALSASFTCIILFASESFPTVVRQNGLGACSVAARIGGLLAPLVILAGDVVPALPLAAYGCTSALASVVPWLLPETLRRPLPDTVEALGGAGAMAVVVACDVDGEEGAVGAERHALEPRCLVLHATLHYILRYTTLYTMIHYTLHCTLHTTLYTTLYTMIYYTLHYTL
ncbi:solute carrier family 22 member 6-A-like [Lampetra planeri]